MTDTAPKITVVQTPSELKVVHALRREVFVEEQNVPESLEYDGLDDVCVHFLATVNDEAVGTGRYRPLADGAIKFERICTKARVRGTGAGKALMATMVAHARKHAPTAKLVMNSQTSAMGFYEKLGWCREGDEFFEAGISHYRLTYRG